MKKLFETNRENQTVGPIHILDHGFPLCGFSNNAPRNWPGSGKWVGLDQKEHATCTKCIDIQRYKMPWEYKTTGKYTVLTDAWGNEILKNQDEEEVKHIVYLASAALERQRVHFPGKYESLLKLWETIENEDQKIKLALDKKDSNNFTPIFLIS